MTHGDYYAVHNLLKNAEYFTSKGSIEKIIFDSDCYSSLTGFTENKKPSYRNPQSFTLRNLIIKMRIKKNEKSQRYFNENCEINQVGDFCKKK